MKKILLCLFLVSGSAHAEQWFEMMNNAGGKIILLDSGCGKTDNGKLVIATTPAGDNVMGCWYYFAEMVHVAWENGKSSSFKPSDFTARKK